MAYIAASDGVQLHVKAADEDVRSFSSMVGR